ncbi:MAG: hypothetical protein A3K03_03000 [Bdellovibrionales bacterium RIFOXYD1_FULL_44_7]|nr:MAG: hypothetical protein A3K03_03000 [Bdellovibrionales bacterium RIFOXYD1_FULL_44_7]
MQKTNKNGVRAVVLDLDGVITHTAKLHSRAWKQLFDEYNQQRIERGDCGFLPFDSEADYLKYVDGKPRQDGVKSFLSSRGINLPVGEFTDSLDSETCHGLGNRKDGYFKKLLRRYGPEVFRDAVDAVGDWKKRGIKTAVASSSRNCAEILRLAGLADFFDVRVDGTHLEKWKMPGKPSPDMFLSAVKQLGVRADESILFEDAISGVEAGKKGQFALVIGVARNGSAKTLLDAGADVVVRKLTEISLTGAGPGLRVEIEEGTARKEIKSGKS